MNFDATFSPNYISLLLAVILGKKFIISSHFCNDPTFSSKAPIMAQGFTLANAVIFCVTNSF